MTVSLIFPGFSTLSLKKVSLSVVHHVAHLVSDGLEQWRHAGVHGADRLRGEVQQHVEVPEKVLGVRPELLPVRGQGHEVLQVWLTHRYTQCGLQLYKRQSARDMRDIFVD